MLNPYFDSLQVIFQSEMSKMCLFQLLNKGFATFLLPSITVKGETLGLASLVGQKRQFEDVTLGSGKLR